MMSGITDYVLSMCLLSLCKFYIILTNCNLYIICILFLMVNTSNHCVCIKSIINRISIKYHEGR